MIASFGNSTLTSRVEFPQVAIMTCGNPTYWTGGRGLVEWQRHPRAPHAKPGPQDQPPFPPPRNVITPTSHTVTGDYPTRSTSKSRLSCPTRHQDISEPPAEESTRQGMCISSASGGLGPCV